MKNKLVYQCAWVFLGLLAAMPYGSWAAIDLLETSSIEHTRANQALLLDIDISEKTILAVGEHGIVLLSENTGGSWQQQATPVSVLLTAVALVNPSTAITVGHDGVILRSTDSLSGWRKVFDGYRLNEQVLRQATDRLRMANLRLREASGADHRVEMSDQVYDAEVALDIARDDSVIGPAVPLLDVMFIDATTGFAVGAYGVLLETTDGGESWQLISNRFESPFDLHFNALHKDDQGDLFIAGEGGSVFRSRDSGRSWVSISTPYAGSLFGIVSSKIGEEHYLLAFGLRGHVFRSTDQGDSWQTIATGTEATLSAGSVLHDGGVVLVGSSGILLTSADGGRSFSKYFQRDQLPSSSIIVKNQQELLVVGMGGIKTIMPSLLK